MPSPKYRSPPGSYTLGETGGPEGYRPTGWECEDSEGEEIPVADDQVLHKSGMQFRSSGIGLLLRSRAMGTQGRGLIVTAVAVLPARSLRLLPRPGRSPRSGAQARELRRPLRHVFTGLRRRAHHRGMDRIPVGPRRQHVPDRRIQSVLRLLIAPAAPRATSSTCIGRRSGSWPCRSDEVSSRGSAAAGGAVWAAGVRTPAR